LPKPQKYRAIRTVVDGITFASKKEAARYSVLLLRQKANEIKELKLQPCFDITIGGEKICTYRADFSYKELDREHVNKGGSAYWRDVVEDVKGFKTPVYRLKKKLVHAIFRIEIQEV
jgi:Protein of unknown function (DUF1064)